MVSVVDAGKIDRVSRTCMVHWLSVAPDDAQDPEPPPVLESQKRLTQGNGCGVSAIICAGMLHPMVSAECEGQNRTIPGSHRAKAFIKIAWLAG